MAGAKTANCSKRKGEERQLARSYNRKQSGRSQVDTARSYGRLRHLNDGEQVAMGQLKHVQLAALEHMGGHAGIDRDGAIE